MALACLRWDRRSRMMKGAQLGSSTAAEDEDENAPFTDDTCGPIARMPHGRDGSDCVVTQLEFVSLGNWPTSIIMSTTYHMELAFMKDNCKLVWKERSVFSQASCSRYRYVQGNSKSNSPMSTSTMKSGV